MLEFEQPVSGASFYLEECALVAGCLPSSWSAMVYRCQAPPHRGYCVDTGRRIWDAAEVLRWQASRPGRGFWARGRERKSPSTRLSGYSLGRSPAHRVVPEPSVPTPVSRTRRRTRPRLAPRVPSLPSVSGSNTSA